jgi:uncharacterized membrane protein
MGENRNTMRNNEAKTSSNLKAEKTLTIVVYALQAASFFVGITSIAGVIINYIKRPEVQGTWLESHFRWQIRTFWFGVLWGVIGIVTAFIVIGFVILIADAIWIIYRIVKGWICLNDGKAMYLQTSPQP